MHILVKDPSCFPKTKQVTMAGFGNYCLKTSASILTLAAGILHQFQKFKNLVIGPQFCVFEVEIFNIRVKMQPIHSKFMPEF